MKALIIDDSPSFRFGLKQYLTQMLNIEVIEEANSGLEALELSSLYKADIILLDIVMEVMDGFETSKQIIWKHPGAKIIAITMYGDIVFLRKLIEAGFHGYVNKKNIFNDLPKAIDEILGGNRFFPEDLILDG